jgi:hypothetical protein
MYAAFIVRLWLAAEVHGLRIMIQNVETGEQKAFTSFEALIDYWQRLYVAGEGPPSSDTHYSQSSAENQS